MTRAQLCEGRIIFPPPVPLPSGATVRLTAQRKLLYAADGQAVLLEPSDQQRAPRAKVNYWDNTLHLSGGDSSLGRFRPASLAHTSSSVVRTRAVD